jgi:hypothetical protein
MRTYRLVAVVWIVALTLFTVPIAAIAADCGPRPCPPDPGIPPESIGGVGIPFDVPIWPVLLKTEFHILPWVKLGKASVCIPGTSKAIEFTCPNFSLKPIPIWIPWLRPLDVECKDNEVCAGP